MSGYWPSIYLYEAYADSDNHDSTYTQNAASQVNVPSTTVTTIAGSTHYIPPNPHFETQYNIRSIYSANNLHPTPHIGPASNPIINAAEYTSYHQSFSDVDEIYDWEDLHSSSETGESQASGLITYEDGSQPPGGGTTRVRAADAGMNHGEDSPERDNVSDDSNMGSLFSGISSIGPPALGLCKSHAEDPSSIRAISGPVDDAELANFQSGPEAIEATIIGAFPEQSEDSSINLLPSNPHGDFKREYFQEPYINHRTHEHVSANLDHEHTMDFVWNSPPPPATDARSPTPEDPLKFFAHLAMIPCADHLPEIEDYSTAPLYPGQDDKKTPPPRTRLTSHPPLLPASDEDEDEDTHRSTPPINEPPPPIVPASTQTIFEAITGMIEKVNGITTIKRRDRQFGMPPPRKCFGLRLPPSREIPKPTATQQGRKCQQQQQQQPRKKPITEGDVGRRQVLAKGSRRRDGSE